MSRTICSFTVLSPIFTVRKRCREWKGQRSDPATGRTYRTSPPVLLTKSTPMVLINDSVNSSSCTAVRVGVSGARVSALRLERTHRKPQQQATLSNARVPDKDELEKVVIVALCLQGSGEAHRRRVSTRPPACTLLLRRLSPIARAARAHTCSHAARVPRDSHARRTSN